MTEEELAKEIERISKMSHVECVRLWRFAPSGHPYFDNRLPLFPIFKARLDFFGGITAQVSKKVGWN